MYSPLHSPPSAAGSLLGSIAGILAIGAGVRIIIRRETKIGPKGGPYNIARGKEAIQIGLGFALLGLFFLVTAILGFIKQNQSP